MAGITKREQINRKIAAAVTKFTPEVIERLRQAFAIDATIAEACLYAKIHPQTYYNWIAKHPELLDDFESLRKTPILKARQTVVNSLGEPDYAFRYMERKTDEFTPRSKSEVHAKVETEDVTGDNAEEIRDIVREAEDNIKKAIAKSHGKSL